MYQQNYNPMGNAFLSTIVAAVPIAVLLYFIALHPHRDEKGVRHLGITAPWAAFYGVLAAFLVSCIPFGMPLSSASTCWRNWPAFPWKWTTGRNSATGIRSWTNAPW